MVHEVNQQRALPAGVEAAAPATAPTKHGRLESTLCRQRTARFCAPEAAVSVPRQRLEARIVTPPRLLDAAGQWRRHLVHPQTATTPSVPLTPRGLGNLQCIWALPDHLSPRFDQRQACTLDLFLRGCGPDLQAAPIRPLAPHRCSCRQHASDRILRRMTRRSERRSPELVASSRAAGVYVDSKQHVRRWIQPTSSRGAPKR
jgi:hypothetical protein